MKDVTIKTPWQPEENSRPPLSEYPRPAMVRDGWMNLNGFWDYAIRERTGGGSIPSDWEGRILVPFAPETALSGVRRRLGPDEELWYHRTFTPDDSWEGKSLRLNFEAVDYLCECFINGEPVGEHCGGYLPFSFDITAALKKGENNICLRVEDPTDTGMQPRGKQVTEPKEIWYEPTSGIWQTVWLETVSPTGFIRNLSCSWSEEERTLSVDIDSETKYDDFRLKAELSEPGGKILANECGSRDSLRFKIAEPELWSPENPVLYGLSLQLFNGEELIDEINSYAALRTVDTAPGVSGHRRIRLNGRPVFVNGLLDQGYWPESGLTAPDERALLFDIEETKKLGFNCLRKHIKIESRRWYYHADRLGILVIQDMVSGGINWTNASLQIALGLRRRDDSPAAYRKSGRLEKQVRDEFENSIEGTIAHLKKHPSIICWVPFNESWGQYDTLRIGKRTEELDPTRPVDHSSGWIDQGGGDFFSVHRYILRLRPKPGREQRVHIISEYGGYNLSVPGHMWDDKKKFGYGFYDSDKALGSAYEKLIRGQLIPLIKRGLSAAVYTQLSDVETESNGIFSYDRRVLKFDSELLRALNDEIYRTFRTVEQL